jgi:hypothetical protein
MDNMLPTDLLPDANFTLKGGIPRKRALSSIKTIADFHEIRDAALTKDNPNVHLQLTLTERADDNEAAEEDDEAPPAKKNKVSLSHTYMHSYTYASYSIGAKRGGEASR